MQRIGQTGARCVTAEAPKSFYGPIVDPRTGVSTLRVHAFYFDGKNAIWDQHCGCGFLGNFWVENNHFIHFAPPNHPSSPATFTNSEAAFQALKFWDTNVHKFANLDGKAAFQLKRKLKGSEDRTYGGYGSNWAGMQAVLKFKFVPGSNLATQLLATGDSLLLEHNVSIGRDQMWSDNGNGSGSNWLGLQLMLLRDELRGCASEEAGQDANDTTIAPVGGTCSSSRVCSWTEWVGRYIDLSSGRALAPAAAPTSSTASPWQVLVQTAADAVIRATSLPAGSARQGDR